MSDFISKISIESFRGIKSLELNDLLPINIATGDNNSGKTSVLEVLRSLGNPGDFRLWRLLTRSNPGISHYEGFYDLFDINSTEKAVDYTVNMNETETNIFLSAKAAEEEMTEEEYYGLIGIDLPENISKEEFSKLLLVPKLKMKIKINGKEITSDTVYEGERYHTLNQKKTPDKYARNVIYISPTRHAENHIFLSQILDNPELYEEMLVVLKEFDEDIISINYDNDKNIMSRGMYKILSKSHKKALPLNVYGDGIGVALDEKYYPM